MTDVHVLVPENIDDPTRPSGGNVYDRRICVGLAERGWAVHEHPLHGSWPAPSAQARAAVAELLAALDDGAFVLVDGLIACAVPELALAASRVRMLVIAHMLVPEDSSTRRVVEGKVLSAAAGVVATSGWTKDRLVERHGLDPARIHVIEPGVDAGDLVHGTDAGDRLLCVAAVTRNKGHDVLIRALASIADLTWHCDCVGALDLDLEYADLLQQESDASGIADRVRFSGTRTGAALAATYATADVLVLASRMETYGMVATEALARGIPVIATTVGGLPSAIGHGADSRVPGILVQPNDPVVLAGAVRNWLSDSRLRQELRQAARQRRETLPSWTVAARQLSTVLTQMGK